MGVDVVSEGVGVCCAVPMHFVDVLLGVVGGDGGVGRPGVVSCPWIRPILVDLTSELAIFFVFLPSRTFAVECLPRVSRVQGCVTRDPLSPRSRIELSYLQSIYGRVFMSLMPQSDIGEEGSRSVFWKFYTWCKASPTDFFRVNSALKCLQICWKVSSETA